MSNIQRLNQSEVQMAEDFFEMVKTGEISHGVACYRLQNGDLRYFIIGEEHFTYALGLMERSKFHMNKDSI